MLDAHKLHCYFCVLAPTINCPTDIIFVVDQSGSIDRSEFNLTKRFLSHLVGRLDIDSGTTRVGLVKFGTTVTPIFYLNTYSSVASVQSAISRLTSAGGFTNTAAALSRVRTSMLTSVRGDRHSAPNVVVVFTDGASDSRSATQVCTLLNCFSKSFEPGQYCWWIRQKNEILWQYGVTV